MIAAPSPILISFDHQFFICTDVTFSLYRKQREKLIFAVLMYIAHGPIVACWQDQIECDIYHGALLKSFAN